jgi:hypothetical protein
VVLEFLALFLKQNPELVQRVFDVAVLNPSRTRKLNCTWPVQVQIRGSLIEFGHSFEKFASVRHAVIVITIVEGTAAHASGHRVDDNHIRSSATSFMPISHFIRNNGFRAQIWKLKCPRGDTELGRSSMRSQRLKDHVRRAKVTGVMQMQVRGRIGDCIFSGWWCPSSGQALQDLV